MKEIPILPPYGNGTLSPGIRSRIVSGVNNLDVHILETGYPINGVMAVPPAGTMPTMPIPMPSAS
jgi:hypothetical protein